MSDNQFGPPQPGFGPPPAPGAPVPPQGGAAPQPGYGYPQQQPQQPWGGGAVPPQQGYPAGAPAGYPAGGFPGYPAPPRKSRKGLWITLSIVSAVILAGVGVIGYFAYDTVSKTGKYKLSVPASFQGMDGSANADSAQEIADQIRKDTASNSEAPEGTAAAVYVADDRSRAVQAGGYYGKFSNPKAQLDAEFRAMERDGDKVGQRKSVDPGPLGGKMDCATGTDSSGEKTNFCLWADYSTVMYVIEESADGEVPLDKIAADARELRQAAEVVK
ncbi:hypothetical protein Kpho02_44920 [Kitasatospora phosalacinea]|uniref:Uncharacterized protein n=1 Tax=Kitasatospora phosalacinea TaxID=2065 RepID=A0A9W6QBY2_9ACTN|nr:hypothetical protein [Kitasatospora phosalacinea]GLW72193.1 hypothetical protein Kpho02_44920 [Kitasatospora phosalacinea]